MRTPALVCFQRKRGDDNETGSMDGTVGTDLALMGVPIFHSNPAPNEARIRYEKPVCRRNPLCKDCNYEANGFVCWHDENRCLRTDIMKIQNRRR